jgi:ribosome biogenesis GTPase
MNSSETPVRPPDLTAYGWNDHWQSHWQTLDVEGLEPARVILQHRDLYRVVTAGGEKAAAIAGRWRHEAADEGEFPAVGDWVAVDAAQDQVRMERLLPRRSQFSRRRVGGATVEQIVAANVDWVLLVNGLDGDFNVARIERYVTATWNCGASPVVVLNKADLCEDIDERVAEVEAVAVGVPVVPLSAEQGTGMAALQQYLKPGQTLALLGSSGVGKSTLVNHFLGQSAQKVAAVREDDSRGRHTTSHRELFLLEGGALLLDTPGMREVQLWADADDAASTFPEIEELAQNCQFRDCEHRGEPGCGVEQAIADGELDARRLESFHKLQSELQHLATKRDAKARSEENRRQRSMHRMYKRIQSTNRKNKGV